MTLAITLPSASASASAASLPTELQRLTDIHKKMVELRLDGMRGTEIATALGIRRETVSRILKSPLFQDTLARRRTERDGAADSTHAVGAARDALNGAARKAVDRLVGLLDSDSEHTALAAAKVVLDKTLTDAGTDAPSVMFTQVNINTLALALQESRNASAGLADVADVIDVEVSEAGTPTLAEEQDA